MKAAVSISRSAVLSIFIFLSAAPLLAGFPTSGILDNALSPNSAGAYQTPACAILPDDHIWQVQAQWIIPKIYRPRSLTGPGRWWVFHSLSIDGILPGCDAQAAVGGLSMNVAVDDAGVSTTTVQGFYQYSPDPPQFFDLAFAVGDHVQMTINSFGSPPTYTLFNLSANLSAVATPSTTQPANCNKNGAFLVNHPAGSAGVPSPLAGFDDFTMSQIIYTYYANDCNLNGAVLFNMVENGVVQVTTTASDSSSLLFHSNI